MVLSFIVIIIKIAPVVEAPTTWYVDDVPGSGAGNPAEDFTCIQDAINASIDGDTVFVYNGTYYEHIVVNKTISLAGEDRENTEINGGEIGDVVRITADWVNITCLTVTAGGNKFWPDYDAGIELDNVRNCWIYNNNVSLNNFTGILVNSSSNNIIKDNIALNSHFYGIFLLSSSNNTVIGNTALNNIDGICLRSSSNNTITNNDMSSGHDHGIELWSSSNNTIIGNIAISNQNDGIYIHASSCNNIVKSNTLSNNWCGIELYSSSNYNIIVNNNVTNSQAGIHLGASLNNTIKGNTVLFSILRGITLRLSSNNNKIIANNVTNNQQGFNLTDAYNNTIYNNNIMYNTNQAYDNTNMGNVWDNGYPSGGNYWSDFDEPGEGAYDEYQGQDQDVFGSDGIVDNGTIAGGGKNPYVIDSDSQDNYPLIEPYKNFLILKQGWNLISLPLIQQEQNLTRVLNSIDGLYDAVQWYDITDAKDPWKHHKVGKPYGNDLSEINETMGFWVNIIPPGDTIFYYNGTQPTLNQTIPLYPGWNLVGYPSLSNKNRTEALNNIFFPYEVDSIWTYDATTQKWKELGPSDYFELGRGYWVHTITKCVWEVPL
jgi:parallel beta-helix repeat protein